MANFELKYSNSIDYSREVSLTIRLDRKPSSEDHQNVLDAIETLDEFANKYLGPVKVVTNKETK